MAANSPFFQGAEVYMTSGGSVSTFARIDRAQSINVSYAPPRSNVPVLGRVKPLANRPVINYTPATASVEYIKGNKDVEYNLGLTNSAGAVIVPGSSVDISTTGAYNIQVLMAPNNSLNYAGQINLMTGVLNSFSLAGSVGDPVKGGFTMEFLDYQQVTNNSARSIPDYAAQVIKPENVTITGIDYTGLGFSGIIIQSFKLDLNLNRTAVLRMGEKYPTRRVTEANATLSINGFIEGLTTNITSLTGYDCGSAMAGQCTLKLLPSCSSEPLTTINMVNPYVESVNIGVQVGSYIPVDIQLSTPLSFNTTEASTGANLKIT